MRFARMHSRSYCGRRNWFRWNTAFAHIETRCIRQSLKSRIAEVTCAENSSLKWLSLKWRALKSLAPVGRSTVDMRGSNRTPWYPKHPKQHHGLCCKVLSHSGRKPRGVARGLHKDAGTGGAGGQLPLQLKMRRGTAPPTWTRGSTYIFEWLIQHLPTKTWYQRTSCKT